MFSATTLPAGVNEWKLHLIFASSEEYNVTNTCFLSANSTKLYEMYNWQANNGRVEDKKKNKKIKINICAANAG